MNTYGSALITESQINNNHLDTSGEILGLDVSDEAKKGKKLVGSYTHYQH